MKRYMFLGSVILLIILAGCIHSGEAQGRPQRLNQSKQFNIKKLSPDLSQLYRNGNSRKKISVLVRSKTTLTQKQIKELASHGILVGTVVNDIFTADMQLKEIPLLMKKPYVKFIELSKRLKLLKNK